MISRISVDSTRMKNGERNAIRVERRGRLEYADQVRVKSGVFVTSEVARPYGATIWFETREPVVMCAAAQEGE